MSHHEITSGRMEMGLTKGSVTGRSLLQLVWFMSSYIKGAYSGLCTLFLQGCFAVQSSIPPYTPPPITLAPSICSLNMPNGTVIGHATRIWEQNIYWPMYSQCGIWDVKGRGVDVWECIKDRESDAKRFLFNSLFCVFR